MKKDYREDISGCNNIPIHLGNEILSDIDEIRGPISLMSKSNQKKAIKYVQNLTKLSELYYSSS